MTIINRVTMEEKTFKNRCLLLTGLLAPIKEEFVTISRTLKETVKKYENVSLSLYHMTKEDIQKLSKNPDYILDIPKYYIKGYDVEVCSTWFDKKIKEEFYERFKQRDKDVIKLINAYNPTYKIIF